MTPYNPFNSGVSVSREQLDLFRFNSSFFIRFVVVLLFILVSLCVSIGFISSLCYLYPYQCSFIGIGNLCTKVKVVFLNCDT